MGWPVRWYQLGGSRGKSWSKAYVYQKASCRAHIYSKRPVVERPVAKPMTQKKMASGKGAGSRKRPEAELMQQKWLIVSGQ